jgi:hypothetical protein
VGKTMTILLAVLIVLNLAMLVAVWQLYRRTSRLAAESRREEAGEQRARWIREMESRERWAKMDLGRMHPVNRAEVATLLRRIEGASTRVLTCREREFLDRMVEAELRATGRLDASGPRHPETRRAVTGP